LGGSVLKYGTQFSNDFLKESGKKGKKRGVREGIYYPPTGTGV